MNGFVSLINALAWPMATVSLALLFRNDIKSMIARVGRVKYRDVEVSFRDDLRQAESLARSIPVPGAVLLEVESGSSAPSMGGEIIAAPRAAVPKHEDSDALERLASRSPREAVTEAWSKVEEALIKTATSLGDRRAPAPIRAEDAARYLVDRGWMTGPDVQLVERTRILRDRVAHDDQLKPSPEEARRFVEVALLLASRIATLG